MSNPSKAEYLVISRGQWSRDAKPAEIQQAIDDFYRWLNQLIAEGKMKTGQRLDNKGATVTKDKIFTDGPYGEAKEVIGGYWFVLANSVEEAAQIASGNPCLKCGLFYEIRPIDPQVATVDTTATETPRI